MAIKQQKAIAVDVGQHSVNMVYANGNGLITKAATSSVPDGVIQNMRVRSPEMLASALQEAKRAGKISGNKCVLCIGGREIIIRYFTLPKMNDYHLYENVVNEIESYLPFSEDHYTIDYCVKEEVEEEDALQYKVMVVAVHNEILEPYMQAFDIAGLKVIRIDIKENCYEKLIKAISMETYVGRTNFGIIDIGASTTTISTYNDGMFFINNTMNYGGDDFTEAIAKLYSIDKASAEHRKKGFSTQGYDKQDKDVIKSMNEFFEKIVSEAARVFNYFKSRNQQKNIEEIFICGGSSVVAGMAGYIEASSDIKTTEIRDVIRMLFSRKVAEKK